MDHNPYAPPKAPLDGAGDKPPDGAPTARFYSPVQLTVAAFLGGLIPVGIMAAANLRVLGWQRQSPLAIVGSVLATVGLFFFGVNFPQIPILVSTGLVTLVVYGIVRPAFAGAVARHRAAGGALASWWRVIGITLVWAVIIGVLGVAAIAIFARQGSPAG